MNTYCCCLLKVNKLVEIKNDPRGLLPNVNKGKQYAESEDRICTFPIRIFIVVVYNKVNKLVEI